MVGTRIQRRVLRRAVRDFAQWASMPMSGHPVPLKLTVGNFVVVRTKSDEEAIRQGFQWNPVVAQRATEFIERFVRHVEGRMKGQPFILLDWQKDIIWRLLGWVRWDGKQWVRRFREIYVEMPKKNGKTILIMALALVLGIADGEQEPQIYTGAVDRQQAGILFDMMLKTIRQDPGLSAFTKVLGSYNKVEFLPGGFLKTMSADAPNKDGVNAHAVIFDELHRFVNTDLWDVMQGSMIARDQPLLISITTAGDSYESLCRKRHEYTVAVNSGERVDLTFDGVIYGCSENADVNDRKVWYRANPSLGHAIKEDEFRSLLDKALHDGPAARSRFFRLHLGMWSEGSSEFIPSLVWNSCVDPELTLDSIEPGTPCFVGVDLARRNDLACVATVFGTSETGLRCFVHAWAPEEVAKEREKLNRWKYLEWADQGLITLTPGHALDFRVIKDYIADLHARFKPKKIYFDDWQATQVQIELAERGVKSESLPQQYRHLSQPTKELQHLALSGKLKTHENALLSWSMGCVKVKEDGNENMMIQKKTTRGKVDPVASLVNAIGGMLVFTCTPKKPKPGFAWVKAKPR